MAVYGFVPPFRAAIFCGVPLCAFHKFISNIFITFLIHRSVPSGVSEETFLPSFFF